MLTIGKWSIGFDRISEGTAVKFDFQDCPSVEVMIPKEAAIALAKAIIAHYETRPPAKLS